MDVAIATDHQTSSNHHQYPESNSSSSAEQSYETPRNALVKQQQKQDGIRRESSPTDRTESSELSYTSKNSNEDDPIQIQRVAASTTKTIMSSTEVSSGTNTTAATVPNGTGNEIWSKLEEEKVRRKKIRSKFEGRSNSMGEVVVTKPESAPEIKRAISHSPGATSSPRTITATSTTSSDFLHDVGVPLSSLGAAPPPPPPEILSGEEERGGDVSRSNRSMGSGSGVVRSHRSRSRDRNKSTATTRGAGAPSPSEIMNSPRHSQSKKHRSHNSSKQQKQGQGHSSFSNAYSGKEYDLESPVPTLSQTPDLSAAIRSAPMPLTTTTTQSLHGLSPKSDERRISGGSSSSLRMSGGGSSSSLRMSGSSSHRQQQQQRRPSHKKSPANSRRSFARKKGPHKTRPKDQQEQPNEQHGLESQFTPEEFAQILEDMEADTTTNDANAAPTNKPSSYSSHHSDSHSRSQHRQNKSKKKNHHHDDDNDDDDGDRSSSDQDAKENVKEEERVFHSYQELLNASGGRPHGEDDNHTSRTYDNKSSRTSTGRSHHTAATSSSSGHPSGALSSRKRASQAQIQSLMDKTHISPGVSPGGRRRGRVSHISPPTAQGGTTGLAPLGGGLQAMPDLDVEAPIEESSHHSSQEEEEEEEADEESSEEDDDVDEDAPTEADLRRIEELGKKLSGGGGKADKKKKKKKKKKEKKKASQEFSANPPISPSKLISPSKPSMVKAVSKRITSILKKTRKSVELERDDDGDGGESPRKPVSISDHLAKDHLKQKDALKGPRSVVSFGEPEIREYNSRRGEQSREDSCPSLQGSVNSTPVWGSVRVIKEEDKRPTEWWVYLVAALLVLVTTIGIASIVLVVFRAVGGPTDREILEEQLAYLSSNKDIFKDEIRSSPQIRALDWLVELDKITGLNVQDKKRIETRYALAVLYFSTGGTMDDETTKWKDRDRFLTKRHVCEWKSKVPGVDYGVGCNDQRQVTSLQIVNNGLRGTLPEELVALSDLKLLDLGHNFLTGSIPLWNFQSLSTLNLSKNLLSGALAQSFGYYLPALTSLDLTLNLLSSTIPSSIGLMSDLEVVRLEGNGLNGTIPDLEDLNRLQHLNMSDNHLSGSLEVLGSLSSLRILDLSSNVFDSTIPTVFSRLTSLQILNLPYNQLRGSLPLGIGRLASLQRLDLGSNQISGTFPWNVFPLTNVSLVEISLPDNLIRGTLPADMSRFGTTLEVINFERNHLSGALPNNVGDLSNLKELQLSRNRLSGKLPATLGGLDSVYKVDLSGNLLSSTIPPTLGSLRSIQTLELSNNDFFGQIPTNLLQLRELEKLGIEINRLTGSVEFLCRGDDLMVSISADCSGPQPEVRCSCCSVCF